MKKFFLSAGLIAAGTAGLQAVNAPDLGPMQQTKPWSISASLRGFYDDNYTTGNSGFGHGSGGFEFSPWLDFNMPFQQTEVGFRYIYGLYYFQDREDKGQDAFDQSHQVDLWIDHAFTERWHGRVEDSLVIGQEPELLDPLRSTVARVQGDNIANTIGFTISTDWTREFSTEFGYQNKFYDYDNTGFLATTTNGTPIIVTNGLPLLNPSLSGTLDRVENSVHLDAQWHLSPTTVAFVGYSYSQVNYTGDEPIAIFYPASYVYFSKSRDNLSHTVYIGTSYLILPNLSLMGRAGAQYTDYYNDPTGQTSFGPYANVSLTYTYNPGSYVQLGVTHARNSTDQVDLNSKDGSITLDQETTAVFTTLNHRITPYLLATLIGEVQYSIFNGGRIDSQDETICSVGLNLHYTFNPHFSAEAGYNYDRVFAPSATGQSYSRDRFYLGVTGTY